MAKPSIIDQMYLWSVLGSIAPPHPPMVAHAGSLVEYSFMKKRAQSRWTIAASSGRSMYSTRKFYAVNAISAPHPKNAQNPLSSVASAPMDWLLWFWRSLPMLQKSMTVCLLSQVCSVEGSTAWWGQWSGGSSQSLSPALLWERGSIFQWELHFPVRTRQMLMLVRVAKIFVGEDVDVARILMARMFVGCALVSR